jgi:hypothetical protein
MADLHDRFRALDRIAAPDLWSEAVERATASAPALGRTGASPGWLGPWFGRVPVPVRLALMAAVLIAGLVLLAVLADRPERSNPLTFATWNQPGLFVVDPAGGSPRRIFDDHAGRIHISPDGRHVFVSRDDTGVALAETDGSGWRPLDLPGEDFGVGFAGREYESVWAPDSHAVAWISRGTNEPTLYVADVVSDQPRRIQLPPTAVPAARDSQDRRPLVWSNDSVHLVYLEWGSCDDAWGPPFIVDTNTGDVRELGSDLEVQTLPVWSRDGRYLAMEVGCRPAGQSALMVGDIASGTATLLAEPLDASSLSWSPDDLTIRWATNPDGLLIPDGLSIGSVPATGGEIREHARLFSHEVVWSPDGSRMTWVQLDDANGETFSLWAADATGGQPRRIADGVVAHALYPKAVWSPDSAWIAFIRGPTHPDGQHGGSLWIVRPDGTDERLVLEGATVDLDWNGVDW